MFTESLRMCVTVLASLVLIVLVLAAQVGTSVWIPYIAYHMSSSESWWHWRNFTAVTLTAILVLVQCCHVLSLVNNISQRLPAVAIGVAIVLGLLTLIVASLSYFVFFTTAKSRKDAYVLVGSAVVALTLLIAHIVSKYLLTVIL